MRNEFALGQKKRYEGGYLNIDIGWERAKSERDEEVPRPANSIYNRWSNCITQKGRKESFKPSVIRQSGIGPDRALLGILRQGLAESPGNCHAGSSEDSSKAQSARLGGGCTVRYVRLMRKDPVVLAVADTRFFVSRLSETYV